MNGAKMNVYCEMTHEELSCEDEHLRKEFDAYRVQNLALDMTRGKPCAAQLDLTDPMLTILKSGKDCISREGIDCRNYGVIDGIIEARELMARLIDDSPERTIVLGTSSLTAMYDTIARCLDFGCLGSAAWSTFPVVKFLCPAPGYDRHFAILEQFGIDMIPIDMTDEGPNMDVIEELVAADASIKGIWCVPKYSNPGGVTYSDDVVRRLAAMQCAAPDFRIFWDNAYCVHHLYADPIKQDKLLDIAKACEDAGNPDRYFKFASTSKITFAGAGICGFAASEANVSEAKQKLNAQLIGHDKLNQLRHARFLPTQEALDAHMAALADVIRPKFELVEQKLTQGLKATGIATWSKPNGGYFVSFYGLEGTAKRTVKLAAEAGVKLTKAGATYPYGRDPHDANIRIAPTMPTLDDLSVALDVFVCCAKLAAIEALQA